ERVKEEADVREHLELPRAFAPADAPDEQRRSAAREWAGERDERVPPRREPGALDRHVRAEERDECRPRDLESLDARRDDVTELMDEDHEHEAERERPAVEPERVRGDRDEDAEELEEDEAPLEGWA